MAIVFVFPSFGAAVGAPPSELTVDDAARTEREVPVAIETQSGDDEAA
jgi:hypothetical protein